MTADYCLFDADGRMTGPDRDWAAATIRSNHYTRSVPSGKSHYFAYEDALVVYAIPANKNIGQFLLGYEGCVWELARLWAPDGHRPNLLTQAIASSIKAFRKVEPRLDAVVSYADPGAGHHGGVYRAASWLFHGQSEEVRAYHSQDGQVKARRAFHSGPRALRKSEIEALGYRQTNMPGKLRFVKPLTHRAKRVLLHAK
jgi:hypothetical protein